MVQVGGIDENEDTLDTIEFFDIDSHKWTLLCKMMVSRSNCCAVYHNEFLYVVSIIHILILTFLFK